MREVLCGGAQIRRAGRADDARRELGKCRGNAASLSAPHVRERIVAGDCGSVALKKAGYLISRSTFARIGQNKRTGRVVVVPGSSWVHSGSIRVTVWVV